MSDNKDIRTDTYGTDAGDLQKFGRGSSTLDSIKQGLDAVEQLRRDQNDALESGTPVRRD